MPGLGASIIFHELWEELGPFNHEDYVYRIFHDRSFRFHLSTEAVTYEYETGLGWKQHERIYVFSPGFPAKKDNMLGFIDDDGAFQWTRASAFKAGDPEVIVFKTWYDFISQRSYKLKEIPS